MAYERKLGLFGEARDLGITIIRGGKDVTVNTIGIATDLTSGARTVTQTANVAVDIFANDIIEDLRNNAKVNGAYRAIELHHANAELDQLTAELAKLKAEAPVAVA